MDFKQLQRLLYDANKYKIDASCLSVREKDRDPKALAALVDAVEAAKNPPEPKAEKPKKAKAKKTKPVSLDPKPSGEEE